MALKQLKTPETMTSPIKKAGIKTAISELMNGEHLSYERTTEAMAEIMDGKATNAQISAYLTALRLKGETVEEITASASVMRNYSEKVHSLANTLDIVGTGGDEAYTFNISTTSAFVIAAAGVPIAKHGNRSASSKSGSADVLEALGINIHLTALQSEKILEELGMCFMFAPTYHPAMKYAAPVRKEIGIRTLFNLLGPLANPAGARMQMLGVYNTQLVKPLAEVLKNLGMEKAMVFCGNDGLDEITLTTTTEVSEIRNGTIRHFQFDPAEYGFDYCHKEELTGGGPEENARITLAVLSGETGAKRDTVICNAGLSIYLAKDNLSIMEAILQAADLIDSGQALAKMEQFKQLSNEVNK
ncbi:MAG: anthranilate phosphoribosyltransferase [Carnobacterium sp.]|uniref:anthranilate phosphoribosyltransferase n=1 Tax=Carnobacterium sp. TaxID=48221 RepID=UPI002FC6E32C